MKKNYLLYLGWLRTSWRAKFIISPIKKRYIRDHPPIGFAGELILIPDGEWKAVKVGGNIKMDLNQNDITNNVTKRNETHLNYAMKLDGL